MGVYMAKIVSSPWSIVRGSIAGTTYTANQYHAIIARQRVAPADPGSQPQNVVRASFSVAVSRWAQLTDAEREAWADYAGTCEFQGPAGNYYIPGREMFLRTFTTVFWLNTVAAAGLPTTYTAPTTPGFLGITALPTTAPTTGETGFRLNFGNANAEDVLLYAERSFAFLPTRLTYHGSYVASTLDTDAITAATAGEIPFYGLTEDRIYFTKARFISGQAPYRLSQLVKGRHVAIATP